MERARADLPPARIRRTGPIRLRRKGAPEAERRRSRRHLHGQQLRCTAGDGHEHLFSAFCACDDRGQTGGQIAAESPLTRPSACGNAALAFGIKLSKLASSATPRGFPAIPEPSGRLRRSQPRLQVGKRLGRRDASFCGHNSIENLTSLLYQVGRRDDCHIRLRKSSAVANIHTISMCFQLLPHLQAVEQGEEDDGDDGVADGDEELREPLPIVLEPQQDAVDEDTDGAGEE